MDNVRVVLAAAAGVGCSRLWHSRVCLVPRVTVWMLSCSAACVLIALGALIAGSQDLSTDYMGYVYILLNNSLTAVSMTMVRGVPNTMTVPHLLAHISHSCELLCLDASRSSAMSCPSRASLSRSLNLSHEDSVMKR